MRCRAAPCGISEPSLYCNCTVQCSNWSLVLCAGGGAPSGTNVAAAVGNSLNSIGYQSMTASLSPSQSANNIVSGPSHPVAYAPTTTPPPAAQFAPAAPHASGSSAAAPGSGSGAGAAAGGSTSPSITQASSTGIASYSAYVASGPLSSARSATASSAAASVSGSVSASVSASAERTPPSTSTTPRTEGRIVRADRARARRDSNDDWEISVRVQFVIASVVTRIDC